jgi:hypothetical protein
LEPKMNRTELLKEATTCGFLSKTANKLANAQLSDEMAAQRAAVLSRRMKRLSRGYLLFCLAAFVLTLSFVGFDVFISTIPPKSTTPAGQIAEKLFAVVLLTGCFSIAWLLISFLLRLIVVDLWANKDELRMLEPIAGTYQCERALACLDEGGPLVAKWRDLALTTRSQLLGVDYDIMQAFKTAYEEERMCAAYQAKLQAACKKVHGVADMGPEVQLPAVTL